MHSLRVIYCKNTMFLLIQYDVNPEQFYVMIYFDYFEYARYSYSIFGLSYKRRTKNILHEYTNRCKTLLRRLENRNVIFFKRLIR